MAHIKYPDNISQLPFVAFDFETTGLSAGIDKIIEIGGVKFQNGLTFSTFATLVDPEIAISPEVTKIHGITDEMVQGKPAIDAALVNFLDFIRGTVLLAHNASFDLGFLQAALKKLELPVVTNPVIDSLLLARRVLPGQPNHKLQTLAAHFRIDPGSAHRAKDDAAVCRDVFYACLDQLPGGRTQSLEKLLQAAGIPGSRGNG